ncbi:hypothetical protein GCM10017744_087550 [Streptomyces antimycoticus]
MERRAGQDQPVDMGDGETHRQPRLLAARRARHAQGARARRAVEVQPLPDPAVEGRQDDGGAIA